MELPWRPISVLPSYPAISTSLTLRESAKLQQMAEGKRVLEIGSAYGFSAITLALTAEHVVAVDPHAGYGSMPNSLEVMRANLEAYGLQDRVSIVVASSAMFLPEMMDRPHFDLCFCDGDHRKESVIGDLIMARQLVVPGGVIAFHDWGEISCSGVREALDQEIPEGPEELIDTLFIHRVPER